MLDGSGSGRKVECCSVVVSSVPCSCQLMTIKQIKYKKKITRKHRKSIFLGENENVIKFEVKIIRLNPKQRMATASHLPSDVVVSVMYLDHYHSYSHLLLVPILHTLPPQHFNVIRFCFITPKGRFFLVFAIPLHSLPKHEFILNVLCPKLLWNYIFSYGTWKIKKIYVWCFYTNIFFFYFFYIFSHNTFIISEIRGKLCVFQYCECFFSFSFFFLRSILSGSCCRSWGWSAVVLMFAISAGGWCLHG